MAMLDTPEWRQGRRGEAAVRQWLEDRGFFVMYAADITSSGAPMLRRNGERLILPDLQAGQDGAARWVEVKTKYTATLCRRHKRREHGLEQRNWEHYLECERIYGFPGYLAILERQTGIVLEATLQRLHVVREHSMMQGVPHWFFPRDAFDIYDGRYYDDGLELIRPAAKRTIDLPPPPTHRQLGLGL